MGSYTTLWSIAKRNAMALAIGVTISDRYVTVVSVTGESMHPTFTAASNVFRGIAVSICSYKNRQDTGFFCIPHSNSLVFLPVLTRVLEPGDLILAERTCLQDYKFSHGDVILFRCPSNHKDLFVKRLIALPGEWMQLPGSSEVLKIPEGHCWVEGDNSAHSWDSRAFGPIPLGLVSGRVTHIIWPPSKIGKLERKMPEGRISPF